MKRLLVLATALFLAACSSMPSWVPGGGWTTLIDGDKGMENFTKVGDANWRAEGGAIVADKGPANSYLLTKKSYKDFMIRAEFWADHTTNSGIFIRIQDPNKIGAENSYEVNIFDQRVGPEYGTAAIVNFAKVPVPAKYLAGGKWNTFEITAKGSNIVVLFNGEKTVEMQGAKFLEGPFGLQFGNRPPKNLPGGAIKWRKVQVKEL
jgi:3-keto-disaccharide hydrolase